jgi:AcrR family transcriptional regulator
MANKARGRRSQAESLRTRERLLDRAERLFARKGYRGMSMRELARACGVAPFTIQHHFGSKLALYQAVLARWDADVLALVSGALGPDRDLPAVVDSVVDKLFDFFLEKRDWIAISQRAALGEGLPRGIDLEEQSWVAYIERALGARRVGPANLDLRLLLITVEGILANHILSTAHYRKLFGADVTDPRLRSRAKRHLRDVILALVDGARAPSVELQGATARNP